MAALCLGESMSRYLIFIIIAMLVYDFVWWFEFWEKYNSVPETWMVALNASGLFVLLPYVLQNTPHKFFVVGSLVWSGVYAVLKVISFQQFNAVIENQAVTVISSVLLYSSMMSPIYFYWRKLREHNKQRQSDT